MKKLFKISKLFVALAAVLIISTPTKLYAKEVIVTNNSNLQSIEVSPRGAWTRDEVRFLNAGDSSITVRLLIADTSGTEAKIIGIDVIASHADTGVSDIQITRKEIYNNGSYAKVDVSYKDFGIFNSETFTFVP